MKLLFCLSLILSLPMAQAYDGCDDIRNETDCVSAPGVCYWNNSNVLTGHACIKFSGYCRDINTTNSTECTQAGKGLLCDWQVLGSGENSISRCVDKCSRLDSTDCNDGDHGYCWGWNISSCLSCTGLTGADCTSTQHCVLDGTTCKVGCGGLYPGNQNEQRYGPYGNDGCLGNSSCYVAVDQYISGYYIGHCENYPAGGCAGIGNDTSLGQRTCNYKGGNWNSQCRWDGGNNVCVVIPTCGELTSQTCSSNSSCYWNSYTGRCTIVSNCNSIQTNVSTDCTNARVVVSSETRNCTYKSGYGCQISCEHYFSNSSNYDSNRGVCTNRGDCWWDSTLVIDAGGNYFNGCKNFTGCSSIGKQDACSAGNKDTCYWNSTNCIPITHCSDISTSELCSTAGSRCNWNTTACVDYCTYIQNQYDCQDRPDCTWNGGTCQDNPSVSIVNCSYIYATSGSCPSERCVYQLGLCLDKIFNPISDEGGRGCSTYNESVLCNANQNPRCVYDSARMECLNYTSCENITYSGFGGVFTRPQTDCNAKQGCIWEVGNDDNACGRVIGKCVEKPIPTSNCINYGDSVACYGASEGCLWNSNRCVKAYCDLYDVLHCEENTSCQWNVNCRLRCSTLTDSSKCRENSNQNGCFWNGNTCSWFFGKENCSNIGASYDDCILKGCDWVSINPVNFTNGSCYSQYEKANFIIRGCDDIKNEKQCNTYLSPSSSLSCTFIWNSDHVAGTCTYKIGMNCSWYKNKQQCTDANYCYWNGNGSCQEFQSCKDISVEDCDTAKNCGVGPGYTTCGGYGCSSRPFGACSGKCEWYKGACEYVDPDRRTVVANANVLSNSDSIVLGLAISSVTYNPCGVFNDRATCNANKTMCNLGCVWNTQYYYSGSYTSASGCILLQAENDCSLIKSPLFQLPEIDCDSRIPCYWNDGKCGKTPPSGARIVKLPHAVLPVVMVTLLWMILF